MAVSRVNLVLYDQTLFHGTGDVNRWMIKLTAQTHAAMVEHAPRRTGFLANSIESEVRHIGTRNIEGVVGPTAKYAPFVLRGTGPRIYPNGKFLRVPKTKGPLWGSELPRTAVEMRPWVRGQQPNNFILKAYRQVRRRHRALPAPPAGVLHP